MCLCALANTTWSWIWSQTLLFKFIKHNLNQSHLFRNKHKMSIGHMRRRPNWTLHKQQKQCSTVAFEIKGTHFQVTHIQTKQWPPPSPLQTWTDIWTSITNARARMHKTAQKRTNMMTEVQTCSFLLTPSR